MKVNCEQSCDASFDGEGDKALLKALSDRLKPTLGLQLPFKTLDVFVKGIESICIGKCTMKAHDVECGLVDLYRLNEKLIKVIELAQQQTGFKTKIKINDMRINLKVARNNETLCSKSEVAEKFSQISEYLGKPTAPTTEILLERINDLEFRLEIADMKHCFVPEFDSEACDASNPGPFIGSEHFDSQGLKKLSKILQDKEWDAFDTKILKAKYHRKLKKLSMKQSKITEMENGLRKKNLDLEKERSLLEKLKESVESLKFKLNNVNQLRITAVKNFLLDHGGFINTSVIAEENSLQIQDNLSIDSEIAQVQQEIKDLEIQYKSRSTLNKHQIESQIERKKNKLITLKSQKAIQSTQKTTFSTAASSTLLLDKSLTHKGQKFKVSPSKIDDVSFIRPDDGDTELRRHLRVKELRLKEREDENFINEERAMKYWEKTLESAEVLKNAQHALLEFKKFKDKYEHRIEFFDKKMLEIHEKNSEIARREAEFFDRQSQFEGEQQEFIKEKHDFTSRVSGLLKTLEKTA